MARLEIHQLHGQKRARRLAILIDRLHREGQRVVVWVADDGRRQLLDDYLWTYEERAFVPHLLWSPQLGEVVDPVVLLGEPSNPNRATALVVGDELPPAGWAAEFEVVHDFVAQGEEGSDRSAFWESFKKDPEPDEAETS